MIVVSGRVRVREGVLKKLRPAMEAMVAASRRDEGCIEYHLGPDLSDPDAFLVLEKWESWEALEAHLSSPYLKAWRATLMGAGLISRDMVAADERDVKVI